MKTKQDSFGPSSCYRRKQEVVHSIYFIALQNWPLWVTCREIILNATCFTLSGKTVNCWGSYTMMYNVTSVTNRLTTLSTDLEFLRNARSKASA